MKSKKGFFVVLFYFSSGFLVLRLGLLLLVGALGLHRHRLGLDNRDRLGLRLDNRDRLGLDNRDRLLLVGALGLHRLRLDDHDRLGLRLDDLLLVVGALGLDDHLLLRLDLHLRPALEAVLHLSHNVLLVVAARRDKADLVDVGLLNRRLADDNLLLGGGNHF